MAEPDAYSGHALANARGSATKPSGRLGRIVAHLLNRGNLETNRRAVAHLDVRSGQRLLDVGFGGGVGMEAMFDVGDELFVAGVDFSAEMVEQQRVRFAERVASGQMQLEEGDVTALPFDDVSFDRVLSSNRTTSGPPESPSQLSRVDSSWPAKNSTPWGEKSWMTVVT